MKSLESLNNKSLKIYIFTHQRSDYKLSNYQTVIKIRYILLHTSCPAVSRTEKKDNSQNYFLE